MAQRKVSIRPDATNANKGTERGRYMVETSLRETGAGRSILLDADGRIIAGNKTFEAATDIGLPVRIVETDGTELIAVQRTDLDLSDPTGTARKLAYFDNRSSQIGLEWDAEQVLADITAGVDLESMFKQDELDELLKDLLPKTEGDAEPQIDRAAELNELWQVQSGDVWAIGEHRLCCGDCTDLAIVAKVMQGEKAQAVVTDPPYGQNQAGVTNDAPELLQGIITGSVATLPIDDAVVVAFSSPRTFPVWLDAIRENGHKFERMLWLYKAAQETFPWRGWILKSESILVSSVGVGQWQDAHPYSHDCYYKSEVSGQLAPESGWHGSVKPLDVVEDLVKRVSPTSAIVFDPFLGSGTTLVACQNLNRRGRGIELSPNYCAVILQRMQDAFGIVGVRLG